MSSSTALENLKKLAVRKASEKPTKVTRKVTHATPSSSPTDLPAHLIVNALAGTGKTSTAEGVCHALRKSTAWTDRFTPSDEQAAIFEAACKLDPSWHKTPPQHITCCAFNKSIAKELQSRMPAGVKAGTLHSFGYGTIKFTNRLRRLSVSDWKTTDIVLDGWGKQLAQLNREERDQLHYIKDLVRLCKMTLAGTVLSTLEASISCPSSEVNAALYDRGSNLSPHEVLGNPLLCKPMNEELSELCDRHAIAVNGSRDSVYDAVRRVLEEARRNPLRIDYADMIWMPVVNGWAPFRSNLLIVDEAQDLNTCQQSLTIMMGEHRIYVGDVHQAIYGFTGSDAHSFENLTAQCESEGGVLHLKLTETRRCGRAIVKYANQWVEDYRAHENNPDGNVVTSLPMKDFDPQVEDMVLCRTNAPLTSMAFKLLAQRKPVAIQGRDIGAGLIRLIDTFKVHSVSDLGPALDEWYSKEETKLSKRPRVAETAIQALKDKVECINVFMAGCDTIKEMKDSIMDIFKDDTHGRIRLSSVHRGKGLEADNVFVIEPQLLPHPMAKQSWEREQEVNLQYVACTRAINNLKYVESQTEKAPVTQST